MILTNIKFINLANHNGNFYDAIGRVTKFMVLIIYKPKELNNK